MKRFTVELTELEVEYIWMLTALDAMRLKSMEQDGERDLHYEVRHTVRGKLFEAKESDSVSQQRDD